MHIRLDTNSPFYIGKGKGKRAYERYGRNKYWNRIVAKSGYRIEILSSNLSEKEAYFLEWATILRFKGEYQLANMSEGGLGGSSGIKGRTPTKGMKFPAKSKSAKEAISKAHKGRKHSEQSKQNMSEAHLGQMPWNRIAIKCLQNNTIYASTSDAAKNLNLSQGNVHNVLTGRRAHTKGYTFERVINDTK